MAYDPLKRRRVADAPRPVTGEVVRVDASGVWVAEVGEDRAHPTGPCRGATGVGGVEVGDVVLLVETDQGPWIAGKD